MTQKSNSGPLTGTNWWPFMQHSLHQFNRLFYKKKKKKTKENKLFKFCHFYFTEVRVFHLFSLIQTIYRTIIQAFISYTVMECFLYFPGPILVLVGERISVSHQSSR